MRSWYQQNRWYQHSLHTFVVTIPAFNAARNIELFSQSLLLELQYQGTADVQVLDNLLGMTICGFRAICVAQRHEMIRLHEHSLNNAKRLCGYDDSVVHTADTGAAAGHPKAKSELSNELREKMKESDAKLQRQALTRAVHGRGGGGGYGKSSYGRFRGGYRGTPYTRGKSGYGYGYGKKRSFGQRPSTSSYGGRANKNPSQRQPSRN